MADPLALARLLVVGEDPGRRGAADAALAGLPRGCSGDRLRALTGLADREYLRVARANLRADWAPGWDEVAARFAARALRRFLPGRVVVLLGERVARAFEARQPWFTSTTIHPNRLGERAFLIAHPHPSGRAAAAWTPARRAAAAALWGLLTRVPVGSPSLAATTSFELCDQDLRNLIARARDACPIALVRPPWFDHVREAWSLRVALPDALGVMSRADADLGLWRGSVT